MRYPATCLAVCLAAAAAHAADELQPTAWTEKVLPLDAVERVSMPWVVVESFKDEDEEHAATGLKDLRFAATHKVDLSPDAVGTWERVGEGMLLWRLRVHSEGALSLNFGFDRFAMTPRGRLFIYSADGKHVYRPFTAEDNEGDGQLWTPPVTEKLFTSEQ